MQIFSNSFLIFKGSSGKSKERLIKGIISTKERDSQGHTIFPEGIVYEDFARDGVVNWHHLQIGNPEAVIGEPKDIFLKGGKLFGVTLLFNEVKLADKVYNLMKILGKYGKSLAYSLEAEVLKKAPSNPNYIEKSLLVGLAITPYPINKGAKVDLVKGLVFNESIGQFQCLVDGTGGYCVKERGEIKEYLEKALIDLESGYYLGMVTSEEVKIIQEKMKEFKIFL